MDRFWRGIGRAVRLPWRDLAESVVVVVVAALVELGVHTMRLPRLAQLAGAPLDLGHGVPAPMDDPLPHWALRRLDIVNAVMRHWPLNNMCLRRSLVAGHRLRKLHPTLRVGVSRDGRVLQAHAWLEIDGRYFDAGASSYQTVVLLSR